MGAIGRELIKMTQQPLIHYTALFKNSPPRAVKSPGKRNSGTNGDDLDWFGPKIGILKKLIFTRFIL